MTTPPIGKPNLLVKDVEGYELRIEWSLGNLIIAAEGRAFELTGNELEAFANEIQQNVGEDSHSCDQDCPCFEEGEDQGRERGEEDICNKLEDALNDEDIDLVQFVTNLVGR